MWIIDGNINILNYVLYQQNQVKHVPIDDYKKHSTHNYSM